VLNTIIGVWDDQDWYGAVTLDGEIIDPAESQKVYNHSPDGFAWGYPGSGPAQLALGILLAFGIPVPLAVLCYQDFKREWIASAKSQATLHIVGDIGRWVSQWRARQGRGLEEV